MARARNPGITRACRELHPPRFPVCLGAGWEGLRFRIR